MRWSKRDGAGERRLGAWLLSIFFLASAFLVTGAPPERRISIYSKTANYSLPVIEHGQDYVGLFEILEPLDDVDRAPRHVRATTTLTANSPTARSGPR